MNQKRGLFFGALFMIFSLGMIEEAKAVVLDLTDPSTVASGFVNGALFAWTDFDRHATGSGVVDPFVRIQHDPTEEGYNTDGRPLTLWPDVHTDATFTHSLQLSSVPIVTLDGVDYREFLLDIGEPGGSTSRLSLDKLQIFLKDSGTLTGNLASLGTPLYNLDVGADGESYVKLLGSLNAGNGKGDMFAYIPDNLFTGPNQFVYLYSQFGTNFSSNGSFEEWAICPQVGGCTAETTVIPEPSSLGLLGLGLFGLWKRRYKRENERPHTHSPNTV